MPVRDLTSTEGLLECGRIQNIAFVSPWEPEKPPGAGKNGRPAGDSCSIQIAFSHPVPHGAVSTHALDGVQAQCVQHGAHGERAVCEQWDLLPVSKQALLPR